MLTILWTIILLLHPLIGRKINLLHLKFWGFVFICDLATIYMTIYYIILFK